MLVMQKYDNMSVYSTSLVQSHVRRIENHDQDYCPQSLVFSIRNDLFYVLLERHHFNALSRSSMSKYCSKVQNKK